MARSAGVQVDRYLSVCCQAAIDRAAFSDGRGFLICSKCRQVLAVEPRRRREQMR
jgi:hypothetical protein